MYFLSPIDGDVLMSVEDGFVKDEKLITTVQIRSQKNQRILINDVLAKEQDGNYLAEISLSKRKNLITAKNLDSGESIEIIVYWFKNAYKTYRLGVDDVIWCFENVYKNQDVYSSIFEDPFLNIFKRLHDKFGTFVHMHLFYQNEDGSFNLSMFPDKYKNEFKANSDWLKFTFHSKSEFPDSPYKNATYEQVFSEGKQVEKEILRFAGKEVLSKITSQHWADSNLKATRAFRDLGFPCIDAYFIFDDNGEPMVSYYLDKEQVKHAQSRDFWVDNSEDIIFIKDDIIINEVPLDKIDSFMESLSAKKGNCFHYLLIHEQYFYKDYFNYESDYEDRIIKTVEWCHKNGYKPSTISSIVFEKED